MAYKLGLEAEKSWRCLNEPGRLGELLAGVRFVDGEPVKNDVALSEMTDIPKPRKAA